MHRYWGKARPDFARPEATRCHLLVYHCLDVAAVGVEALHAMPALSRWVSQRLGLPEHQAHALIAFWLGLHDLGKFSEAFQSQCPDVFAALRGREADVAKPYTVRHDSLGMLFWKEVLRERVIDDAWFGPCSEDLAGR